MMIRAGIVSYASFGRRAAAKIIDWFIVTMLNILTQQLWQQTSLSELISVGAMVTAQMMFQVAYSAVFLERFSATPGKLMLGMLVVTTHGEKLQAMKAFARSVAELLSVYTVYIGYLIALKDHERRTLHDRICGTRVITKRSFSVTAK